MNSRRTTMRRIIAAGLFLTANAVSTCGKGGLFGPTPTPTATATSTVTSTPTRTTTPSVTPTVTPIPLVPGLWNGLAEGWDPPLTVSFVIAAEGTAYQIMELKVYIPEIDLAHFAATLINTSCTLRVERLEIVDNGFIYPAGAAEGARILEAEFDRNGAGVTGSLYGGWLCEDRRVQFYQVKWHAQAGDSQ